MSRIEPEDLAPRRAQARRTALLLALVALALYLAFLLRGLLGGGP